MSGNQQANTSDVAGQQQVGLGYDAERYVLVEKEKLSNVGDINNAIHDAKAYRELQKNGTVDLGGFLSEKGYSPWEIQRILDSQAAGEGGIDLEQQPPPAPTDHVPSGLDESQVQRMIQQGIQTFASQQTTQQAFDAENRSMSSAVETLGMKDEIQGLLAKSQLEALCRRTREQNIHASNPNRHALINAPYTQAEITTATNELKPYLAAQAQTRQEKQADIQATQNFPGASLTGAGIGGRSQTPTSEMSRDQLRAEAEARFKAKRGRAPVGMG